MLSVVLGLTGCSVTLAVVRGQAAADLHCPAEQLAIDYLYHGDFLVSGCGVTSHYACRNDFAVCARVDRFGELSPERSAHLVRLKAQRLLGCDALAVQGGAAGRYVVEGCGDRREYECLARADCCALERHSEELDAVLRSRARQPPGVHGTLPKSHIRAVIGEYIDQVRACYARSLQPRAAARTGVVEIRFLIDPTGAVTLAALAGSSLGDPGVEQCVVDVARTLRFDAPEGGGAVVVHYPFVLKTPQGPFVTCP